MDVKIEAAPAGMVVEMIRPAKVRTTIGFIREVVLTTQVVATSILRTLRQGRSSLSAIPGDVSIKLNGGEAVAF